MEGVKSYTDYKELIKEKEVVKKHVEVKEPEVYVIPQIPEDVRFP